jgi:hypothetical protein
VKSYHGSDVSKNKIFAIRLFESHEITLFGVITETDILVLARMNLF